MSNMKDINWLVVEKFVAERQPVSVEAGLLEDWYWTAATVYENGKWLDRSQAFTASPTATPAFKAVMANGDVIEIKAVNFDDV